MSFKSIVLGATTLALSTSVNAVVVNTLNGVDYEWLELTETISLSRNAVQAMIDAANSGDLFYGYEYASRQLTEDLLLSYAPWDGLNGDHTDPAAVLGSAAFLNDFGNLSEHPTTTTERSGFLYGELSECGGPTVTCAGEVTVRYRDGVPYAVNQWDDWGWDADFSTYDPSVVMDWEGGVFGSLLVRPTVVPVPASMWLFGSGLIGLIGVARRKNG